MRFVFSRLRTRENRAPHELCKTSYCGAIAYRDFVDLPVVLTRMPHPDVISTVSVGKPVPHVQVGCLLRQIAVDPNDGNSDTHRWQRAHGMPGLIDAHTHLMFRDRSAGGRSTSVAMRASFKRILRARTEESCGFD